MASEERLRWVVEQLDVGPAHHVLEIGPGYGVAASLVLERLTTGTYTGVDRSAKMIEACRARLGAAGRARLGEAGRVALVAAELRSADLDGRRFDRVVAANVAPMARPADLRVAVAHLAPGGRIVLSYESPGDARTAALVADTERLLAAEGLSPTTATTTIGGHPVSAVAATRT